MTELIEPGLKPDPSRGYIFCPLLFSLFSTSPIRREVTEFFYQSDVKEASGMSNIPFGLALIDTLDVIEEALLVKARVLFQFHFNLGSNTRFSERKLPLLKR